MKRLNEYLIKKWEYLPSYLLHIPTAFMYLFFSLRSRSFLFFTNISNDYKSSDIENSSKHNVYQKLNKKFYPTTVLLRTEDFFKIKNILISEAYGLEYPIIVKPNVGKRGLGAILINNHAELIEYCAQANYDILLQEYIDSLNECGIFYVKNPDNNTARITSIGLKRLPTIVGDGLSNLKTILKRNNVSAVNEKSIAERYDLKNKILNKGQELIIEPIGAHCRGAKISAANHLISPELLIMIEQSLSGLNLYYGRLDIKYDTWEGLLDGQFKIIEVNTITSEPLSIYDQNIPISEKYKIIYAHLKSMYEISRYLRQIGRPILKTKMFITYMFHYREHLKRISAAKV